MIFLFIDGIWKVAAKYNYSYHTLSDTQNNNMQRLPATVNHKSV